MRTRSAVFALAITLMLMGCNGGSPGSSMTTTAVLKGSGFARTLPRIDQFFSRSLWPSGRVAATLTNITGKADSLLVLNTEDYCGFTAWAANSQTGPVAISGRTVEDFDLGDPENWTSTGSGLRDGCSGGTIIGLSAYFAYMDLDIEVASTPYTLRIAMGEYGNYKAGDVLVKVAGVFNWVADGGSTLTPETSARPSTPHQYTAIKDFVPFNDGGSSDLTVLDKLDMSVTDATEALSVSTETSKVVVDIDFTTASLSTDATSAATVVNNLAVQFLDDYSLLTATVTPLTSEEKGGATDPAPTVGNGE